ncbi:MAG: hypothetical protein M4579_004796 [Chaenotheca gracillima]|nr:MAG: hypothetical protein M4579_004796 [Chaenotheca gracillima]
MGKSRSATCVIAYLMQKHHVSPQEALAQIRRYRPMCEPNEGFMQQLEVYHEMSCDDELDENPIYQRWLYQQDVELSRACGRPPDQVRFEDEHGGIQPGDDDQNADFRLSCRKCRRTLATSQYLIQHEPGKGGKNLKRGRPAPESSGSACAHYFLDPLSWMRPELEQGKMEGRFECPKCRANVGKYAWQGMACSCGHWIIPGISLARGRVDEVKSRTAPSGHDAFVTRPPGVGDGSSGAGGLPAGRGGQKGSL